MSADVADLVKRARAVAARDPDLRPYQADLYTELADALEAMPAFTEGDDRHIREMVEYPQRQSYGPEFQRTLEIADKIAARLKPPVS